MSNTTEWYEDDDDYTSDDDYGQNEGLKNLRKADRDKAKKIKELEAELQSLRDFQRKSVVSSVLNDKGVNPKIAAFIPQDISTDAEAIGKWLEEYGDVFGVQTQSVAQEKQVNPDLAALRQIDNVVNTALSPDDFNDLSSRIDNAQSQEELINLILGN